MRIWQKKNPRIFFFNPYFRQLPQNKDKSVSGSRPHARGKEVSVHNDENDDDVSGAKGNNHNHATKTAGISVLLMF